ncbi:hypothetical protein Tsubulata_046049 [Turnera subulata]|uniref:endo-polygalacturonase n=1 Tax=Turnera subulata TaxID=218843 RepID=A0A9Q0IZX4_9ROSI|nr:hypothetical protein Tsubulata_046049 [Turnera subulata]
MASQRCLYPYLLIIFLSIIAPCYNCLQEDPLNNYIEEISSAYDSQAYPSMSSHLSSSIADGGFQDLIRLKGDVLSLERSSHKVGGSSTSVKTVSVDDFGAKADGTDDTQAFEKAWKEACSYEGAVLFIVPQHSYNVKQVRFLGPCQSDITVQIYGTIEASDDRSDYEEDGRHWLLFSNVQNLLVEGGGVIDGNGKIWWQHSCKVNKALALTFYNCKNLVVQNLKIQNAQQMHVTFDNSQNVQVSNVTVTSPRESPNTDGIHVTGTKNIRITNSIIGTGDDCISIVSGSQNVEAEDITCGPGHGISIGSLGSKNSKAYVSGVTINGAKLSGTTNGVRIKTWQGGSGSASNIKFQNIEMHNVTNPIIIDQNYCDQDKPCKEQKSAVQVKNVVYQNIKGTSASSEAITFDCSKSHPCQGILLQDVSLVREGGETAKALCKNVKLADLGVVSPHCP